jgi:hypothetical protein
MPWRVSSAARVSPRYFNPNKPTAGLPGTPGAFFRGMVSFEVSNQKGEIMFPKLYLAKQTFPRPRVADIQSTVYQELENSGSESACPRVPRWRLPPAAGGSTTSSR